MFHAMQPYFLQGARVKYSGESYCRISYHPNLKTHLEDIDEELSIGDKK